MPRWRGAYAKWQLYLSLYLAFSCGKIPVYLAIEWFAFLLINYEASVLGPETG
jgi:hypothetical protein